MIADRICSANFECELAVLIVNESEFIIPSISNYLPEWSEARFVVLEPATRWAPAIGLEVAECLKRSQNQGRRVRFESCRATRDVLLLGEAASTVGLILFIQGMERDCLGLLRRLPNLTNRPDVLVVCETQHTALIPVILESGVSSVLMDVKNDVPIAEWCHKVVCGRG